MSDTSYSTKVYDKIGGDELVVKAGGMIRNQGYDIVSQPAPTVLTVANQMTIAQLLTKIINATPTATGATAAYTLPTGANIDLAGLTLEVDDSFEWVIINNALAALDTITITASTGHTIVGGPIVQSLHASTGGVTGYSATFRTRKTAADTYVTYRVA